VGFEDLFIRDDVRFVIKDIFDTIVGGFGLALFHMEGQLTLEIALSGREFFLCYTVFKKVIQELDKKRENPRLGFIFEGFGGVTKGIYFKMSGGCVMGRMTGGRISETVFFTEEHEEPAGHVSADDIFKQ
jgi:hypothetical protein